MKSEIRNQQSAISYTTLPPSSEDGYELKMFARFSNYKFKYQRKIIKRGGFPPL